MAFANERTHILSTEQMVNYAKRSPKQRFLIATETGIIHRLNKEVPGKSFEPIRDDAVCRYMKMITLEKLHATLRGWQYEVTVDAEIAVQAARAIGRMVAIGA
jgi:quinolinate synthase